MSQFSHRELPAKNPKAWNPLLSLSVSQSLQSIFPAKKFWSSSLQLHRSTQGAIPSVTLYSVYLFTIYCGLTLSLPVTVSFPVCASACVSPGVFLLWVSCHHSHRCSLSHSSTLQGQAPVSGGCLCLCQCQCQCQPGSVAFVSLEVLPLCHSME